MPSRNIKDLDPALQPLCIAFQRKCAERGFEALVTCTWRSPAEQMALYAQGRTKPGPKVTWTRTSKHNVVNAAGKPAARAFDFVPLVGGKALWRADAVQWEIAGTAARELGLTWGGDWAVGKKDMPHVELPS